MTIEISEASDAPLQGAGLNRAVWRRESALLIALAVLGEVLKSRLARALKFVERAHIIHAYPILAIVIVTISMVPFAVRINPQLGLPGAPLIMAKLAGEKVHVRIRSLLKISVGYALLALAVSALVALVVLVPIKSAHRNMKFSAPPMMKVQASRIAIMGALAAIAAGVSEEIEFRLVLFALFTWLASLIARDSLGAPSRAALWFATFLQAYVFGMLHMIGLAHRIPLAASMLHTVPAILVGGLVMPQTWAGIVLGRLYLKRGLEASMLAHATFDFLLFMFLAAIVAVLRSLPSAGLIGK